MNDSPGSRIRVFGHKTTGRQEDVKSPGEPPDQKHAMPSSCFYQPPGLTTRGRAAMVGCGAGRGLRNPHSHLDQSTCHRTLTVELIFASSIHITNSNYLDTCLSALKDVSPLRERAFGGSWGGDGRALTEE